jgi:hypothetical protein
MKKFAVALIAMSAVIFGSGMAAQAQYGGGSGTATVTPASSAPGGSVTVTISGCAPGSSVEVEFNGATSTVTADSSGAATAGVTAPSTAGTYPGTATCGDVVSSFSVVVAVAVTPPGGLPATGSNGISTTSGLAIGLLVVGLGLFAVAQMRRRQTSAA